MDSHAQHTLGSASVWRSCTVTASPLSRLNHSARLRQRTVALSTLLAARGLAQLHKGGPCAFPHGAQKTAGTCAQGTLGSEDLAQLRKHGQRHAAPGLQQQRVQRYGGLAGLRGCLDINFNITQHGISFFAASIHCLLMRKSCHKKMMKCGQQSILMGKQVVDGAFGASCFKTVTGLGRVGYVGSCRLCLHRSGPSRGAPKITVMEC